MKGQHTVALYFQILFLFSWCLIATTEENLIFYMNANLAP